MSNLFEGLKEGDLEDLVVPLLSIDEYESKLDDDSIVIAFALRDKEPAQDLNRFIQKGAVDILDTDVSPAPNEDGNYMVFVEMLRDETFPQGCIDMVSSLIGLTHIEDWMASIYDQEEQMPLDMNVLQTLVRLQSREDHEEPELDAVEESLQEFFRASDLDNMAVAGHTVVLEARGVTVELHLVDLGAYDDVLENNAVMSAGTRLDESALNNVRRINRMLGDHWMVDQRSDYVVVANAITEECALFRL